MEEVTEPQNRGGQKQFKEKSGSVLPRGDMFSQRKWYTPNLLGRAQKGKKIGVKNWERTLLQKDAGSNAQKRGSGMIGVMIPSNPETVGSMAVRPNPNFKSTSKGRP